MSAGFSISAFAFDVNVGLIRQAALSEDEDRNEQKRQEKKAFHVQMLN
jgi:hypothetical protein